MTRKRSGRVVRWRRMRRHPALAQTTIAVLEDTARNIDDRARVRAAMQDIRMGTDPARFLSRIARASAASESTEMQVQAIRWNEAAALQSAAPAHVNL